MAISAYEYQKGGEGIGDGSGMPMELQLDMLVDGELSDGQRAQLLRRLDAQRLAPAGMAGQEWRDLALRFLQQQTEKRTVRELMAGGTLVPTEWTREFRPAKKFPLGRWITLPGLMATAAGLLIAATSALITLYVVRPQGQTGENTVVRAMLPGETLGVPDNTIQVDVDVVKRDGSNVTNVFPASMGAVGGTGAGGGGGMRTNGMRRSVVIQPDGRGNVVVFPVNTWKVY